jgi:hypothetical protein
LIQKNAVKMVFVLRNAHSTFFPKMSNGIQDIRIPVIWETPIIDKRHDFSAVTAKVRDRQLFYPVWRKPAASGEVFEQINLCQVGTVLPCISVLPGLMI